MTPLRHFKGKIPSRLIFEISSRKLGGWLIGLRQNFWRAQNLQFRWRNYVVTSLRHNLANLITCNDVTSDNLWVFFIWSYFLRSSSYLHLLLGTVQTEVMIIFRVKKICVNIFFTRVKSSDRYVVKFFSLGWKNFHPGQVKKSSDFRQGWWEKFSGENFFTVVKNFIHPVYKN